MAGHLAEERFRSERPCLLDGQMTRMKPIPRILVSFDQGLPVVFLGQDKKRRINPNGGPFLASDPGDPEMGRYPQKYGRHRPPELGNLGMYKGVIS